MADEPIPYVCHGDDQGPRMHPCPRVQEALRSKGIAYERVIAAHGSPIPFLRKGSREELERATGRLMSLSCRLDRFAAFVMVVAAALAGAASASADPPKPSDPYQWTFHGSLQQGAPLASTYNADYSIANLRNWDSRAVGGYDFLTGHSRTFGVGLDWGDGKQVTTGLRRWSFKRRSGASGPIAAAERVGLYDNFSHLYLAQGDEHFGIDLAFRSSAVYDWQVHLRTSGVGTLYNTDARDYLVSYPRNFGVQLMWLRDADDQLGVDKAATEQGSGITLAAQRPVGGYIPFTGTWGGGPTSYGEKALRISVPSRGYTTGFLKRGRRRSCSRYQDSVWVDPGHSLTAAQSSAVFGTATPPMPVSFRTCVRSEPGVTLGLQTIRLAIWFYGVGAP